MAASISACILAAHSSCSKVGHLLSGEVRMMSQGLHNEGQNEVWVLMQHGAA